MGECPCKIPPKHHAVILDLVYGVTDAREAPRPVSQPLTQAQAWARHYKARDKSADTACGRMLEDVGQAESLAWHRAEKEQASLPWAEELKGLMRARARADLADYMEWGDPDPDAHESLYRMIFTGVEDSDAPGDPNHSPWPGISSPLPAGRKRATPQQIQRALERCTDPRIKPSKELTKEQTAGLAEYVRSRHGDVKLKTHAIEGAKLSAHLEGLIEQKITVIQAEEVAGATLQRLTKMLPGFLQAVFDSELTAWMQEQAASAARAYRRMGDVERARVFESLTSEEASVSGVGQVVVWGVGRG